MAAASCSSSRATTSCSHRWRSRARARCRCRSTRRCALTRSTTSCATRVPRWSCVTRSSSAAHRGSSSRCPRERLMSRPSSTRRAPPASRRASSSPIEGCSARSNLAALFPSGLRHDEAVVALPVAHIYGFTALLGLAAAGVPVHYLPRFRARRRARRDRAAPSDDVRRGAGDVPAHGRGGRRGDAT